MPLWDSGFVLFRRALWGRFGLRLIFGPNKTNKVLALLPSEKGPYWNQSDAIHVPIVFSKIKEKTFNR
jgi:hypothetical protein